MSLSFKLIFSASLVALLLPVGSAPAAGNALTSYQTAGDIARRLVANEITESAAVRGIRRLGGSHRDGQHFYYVIAAARDAGTLTQETTNWTEIAKIAYTQRFADNSVVLAAISTAATGGESGATKDRAYTGPDVVFLVRQYGFVLTPGFRDLVRHLTDPESRATAYILIQLPQGSSKSTGPFVFSRFCAQNDIELDAESFERIGDSSLHRGRVEAGPRGFGALLAHPGMLWAGNTQPTKQDIDGALDKIDAPAHSEPAGKAAGVRHFEEVRVVQATREGIVVRGPNAPPISTTLILEVLSREGSKAEDFDFVHYGTSEEEVLILVQKRPDTRERPAKWNTLTFHLTTVGPGPVRLLNPGGGRIPFRDNFASAPPVR